MGQQGVSFMGALSEVSILPEVGLSERSEA